MADNNDTGDKKLTVGGGKTLSLKRPIETGIVKQSFSHGRTNAVVVETVKRRPGPVEVRPGKPVFNEPKAQPVSPPRRARPCRRHRRRARRKPRTISPMPSRIVALRFSRRHAAARRKSVAVRSRSAVSARSVPPPKRVVASRKPRPKRLLLPPLPRLLPQKLRARKPRPRLLQHPLPLRPSPWPARRRRRPVGCTAPAEPASRAVAIGSPALRCPGA